MSINFLKFIKISAKMHPGVYVHVTCVLLLLCDVIPETEYEWILLIEVLFSY